MTVDSEGLRNFSGGYKTSALWNLVMVQLFLALVLISSPCHGKALEKDYGVPVHLLPQQFVIFLNLLDWEVCLAPMLIRRRNHEY